MQWGVMSRVLENTGAEMRTGAILYKEVVQTVLLYGSNSWVIMGAMMKVL